MRHRRNGVTTSSSAGSSATSVSHHSESSDQIATLHVRAATDARSSPLGIYGERMGNWRTSGKTAVIAIVVFLIIQVGIPLGRLHPPETPHRWGWQMFSRTPHNVQFQVETPTGVTEAQFRQYMARTRGDIDLTKAMPAHLCYIHPNAVRVTWDSEALEC